MRTRIQAHEILLIEGPGISRGDLGWIEDGQRTLEGPKPLDLMERIVGLRIRSGMGG